MQPHNPVKQVDSGAVLGRFGCFLTWWTKYEPAQKLCPDLNMFGLFVLCPALCPAMGYCWGQFLYKIWVTVWKGCFGILIKLNGKSTIFHMDFHLMLMVIVVMCSNKFLSLCYTDRESWVFWAVLLTQLFLQCLHVPGCIASQKNSSPWVSKVISYLSYENLLFNLIVRSLQ